MKFSWLYEDEKTQSIKNFLKTKGVSRKLLAKVKFQGGEITVNQQVENVLYLLKPGDILQLIVPDEGEHETLLIDDHPIDIIYEDDHFLVVNKPTGVASIPAQYHPNGTMANRVKNYYCQKGYVDRVVHIVTRLDRDTTGLMLFAKHGFAHALIDQQLRNRKVKKLYQALVGGSVSNLKLHGWISGSIGREEASIMKRKVVASGGKQAETEYWLQTTYGDYALVKIQLHTGRTHQIRVHFSSIECALLGDNLYGGSMETSMQRQALHCGELRFWHPFIEREMLFQQDLPQDMKEILK